MPHATVCATHNTLVPDGERCPACAAADDRRRAAKSRAHGLTLGKWRGPRGRRAAKLRRSPLCELELEGCTGAATSVHIPPRYRGNHRVVPDRELVSACAHCHGVIDGGRAHAARRG